MRMCIIQKFEKRLNNIGYVYVTFKLILSKFNKMQNEIDKYLLHRNLLQKSQNEADVKRKCLIQTLHESYKSMDNISACYLLENSLKNYTECVVKGGSNIYDCKVKEKLNNFDMRSSDNFTSGLNKIDIINLVEPLACSNSKNYCEVSEDTSFADYDEFLETFQEKCNKIKSNERKSPKAVKSSLPRSKQSKLPVCKTSDNFSNQEVTVPKFYFKTAREELDYQNSKSQGQNGGNAVQKRKLGTRRILGGKFVSPLLSKNNSTEIEQKNELAPVDVVEDERLKNIDPRMVELIRSEIMDNMPVINWDDIAGLDFAKNTIQEAVVWPLLRPDIFTGLRRPPKGILLFGPPGTGKTLIGKCVATQSKSTFFSISASSLTSKWVGDGEKMVRALFAVARCHQPAVIFIDEIDSLLSQRSDTEHESSRRIKTEFLVQLDGATTENEERLLVIGATNRPQELDEAARRRFVKRLYIPLPKLQARLQLVEKLMESEKQCLNKEEMTEIAKLTEGYSGADIKHLCSDACLGPIRSLDLNVIEKIQPAEVRPVNMEDFQNALTRVRSSVSASDLHQYVTWDGNYGSGISS